PRQMLEAAGTGLAGYFPASVLDFKRVGFIHGPPGRPMLFSYPALVIIPGALVFGQAFQRHHLIALLLTYAGLLLVYGQDLSIAGDIRSITTGTLLVLGSGYRRRCRSEEHTSELQSRENLVCR